MEKWQWLVDVFTFIGMAVCILIALIAIVLCVGGTISKHTLQKASFPIGYSNVAGILASSVSHSSLRAKPSASASRHRASCMR